jgi:hypothetical protein
MAVQQLLKREPTKRKVNYVFKLPNLWDPYHEKFPTAA